MAGNFVCRSRTNILVRRSNFRIPVHFIYMCRCALKNEEYNHSCYSFSTSCLCGLDVTYFKRRRSVPVCYHWTLRSFFFLESKTKSCHQRQMFSLIPFIWPAVFMAVRVFFLFFFAFTRHANDVLKNETTMFEKYLKRVDPKDIGLQQASE